MLITTPDYHPTAMANNTVVKLHIRHGDNGFALVKRIVQIGPYYYILFNMFTDVIYGKVVVIS